MLSSGNLGVGVGLDVLWRLNAAAVDLATTWSFAAYAQANSGALPGPWANVRRTGTATYENASGVITTLPDLGGGTYAARVQYRSGTARGLLIEGQATQLAPTTQDIGSGSWSRIGLQPISSNSAVAPDGTTTADKMIESVGSNNHWVYASLGASGFHHGYVFAKAAERSWIVLRTTGASGAQYAYFNLSTGAVGSVGAGLQAEIRPWPNGWYQCIITATLSASAPFVIGIAESDGVNLYTGDGASGLYVWGMSFGAGPVSSYIPNSGSGTAVRVGDFEGVFLTSSALSAAFPGGVGQPWTTVFQYRKGYSVSSDETLFALSAGSSAGSTNLLALQVNGTQAQAVHSGGSGTLSGTLVHDGSTVNKIALSVDPVSGKVSVSVNGAAAVETTGIAFTGSGTTHLIPGARTTGGSTPVLGMEIYDWRNVNTAYTTGASLQALSA